MVGVAQWSTCVCAHAQSLDVHGIEALTRAIAAPDARVTCNNGAWLAFDAYAYLVAMQLITLVKCT